MTLIKADVVIRKPIFRLDGVEPAFGINESLFDKKREVYVYTPYRRIDGSVWNPNVYSVTREVAMDCKPSQAKGGVHLRMVPLRLMRVVGKWVKEDPLK